MPFFLCPPMSKKLEVLEKSLVKKVDDTERRWEAHVKDVKSANGQPLNDKRNGHVTLKRWDKQHEMIGRGLKEVERTTQAIEVEKRKIAAVEDSKDWLPAPILARIENGELIQWRRNPNICFVPGIEYARIGWDRKKRFLWHKNAHKCETQEQFTIFRQLFNALKAEIDALA